MATGTWKVVGYVSLALWNVVCLLAMYVLVCGILNFWYTAQVNSYNSAIIARRPRLVLMAAISSLLQIPLFVCATYNLRLLLWVEAISGEAFNRGNRVSWLLFSCSMWTLMLWNSLRFWLAYFDILWSVQQRDTKLLRYLDPSYEYKQKQHAVTPSSSPLPRAVSVSETGAAIDNEHAAVGCCNARKCCGFAFVDDTLKQTYGDVKWMSTRVAVVNVLLIGVSFLLAFINYSLLLAFIVFSLFLFAVYLFFLQRLTPKFDDCIALRDEQHAFRRLLQVGAYGALIWLIAIVIDMAMGGPKKHPGSSPRPVVVVAYVVAMHCILISTFGSGFIPTLYVIYCTDLVKRVNRHYTLAWLRPAVARYRLLMDLLCTGFVHGIAGHMTSLFVGGDNNDEDSVASNCSVPRAGSLSSTTQPTRLKLKDVIADSNGLRAFSVHLFKEFSQENILCLIEVLRFRNMWNAESLTVPGETLLVGQRFSAVEIDVCSQTPEIVSMDIMHAKSPVCTDSQKSRPSLEVPNVRSSSVKPMSSISELMSSPSASPRSSAGSIGKPAADKRFAIRFPTDVSLAPSAIVNESLPIEMQFQLLCHKYIQNSTQFCVNIPYRMRKNLIEKRDALKDAKNTESFAEMFRGGPHTAFDGVIMELMKLLRDSFWRFDRTEEYKRLQAMHDARHRESQQEPGIFEKVTVSLHNSMRSKLSVSLGRGGTTPVLDDILLPTT